MKTKTVYHSSPEKLSKLIEGFRDQVKPIIIEKITSGDVDIMESQKFMVAYRNYIYTLKNVRLMKEHDEELDQWRKLNQILVDQGINHVY